MKLIGLTGGIASGKTVVSNYLIRLGAPVVDADVIAREVVEVGQPAYDEVVKTFGCEVLQEDGGIDRRKLGEIVFRDQKAREALNRIMHPRIRQTIMERVEALRTSGAPAAVISAALLVETSMCSTVDVVWVVAADPRVQRDRLMDRDGYSHEEAEARLAAQLPLTAKLKCADEVIDNNGTLEQTFQQVERLWSEVMRGGGESETVD